MSCQKHPQAYLWPHHDGTRCAICGEMLRARPVVRQWKTIAEQCAERGVEVPIGKTAGELLGEGFEIPGFILSDWKLEAEKPEHQVNQHAFGRRTGFVWCAPPGFEFALAT